MKLFVKMPVYGSKIVETGVPLYPRRMDPDPKMKLERWVRVDAVESIQYLYSKNDDGEVVEGSTIYIRRTGDMNGNYVEMMQTPLKPDDVAALINKACG